MGISVFSTPARVRKPRAASKHCESWSVPVILCCRRMLRMKAQSLVLCIQDGTDLNYSGTGRRTSSSCSTSNVNPAALICWSAQNMTALPTTNSICSSPSDTAPCKASFESMCRGKAPERRRASSGRALSTSSAWRRLTCPPRQNSCRLHRTKNPGAAKKDGSGSIRTIIQGPRGGAAAAAGERGGGAGGK